MQKVLQVIVNGNGRERILLADAIHKQVDAFLCSVNGVLDEFQIAGAELTPEGFGHALVAVKYRLETSKTSYIEKKGGQKHEGK